MSLNYDISKTAQVRKPEEVQDAEWGTTQGIIFQTMSNGMGDLTEKNEAEFYARQLIWNRMHGFTPFTPLQIHEMVGLHTNVSLETMAQWRTRTVKRAVEEALYQFPRKLAAAQEAEIPVPA